MSTFPATESTLSALHLGEFLRDQYGLGPETACKLFRTGINHLYLVSDNGNKFVFRIYTLNWRAKSAITEELRLLLYLKQNNIPVSYPVSGHHEELIQEFNAPEGIRYGVLFSFAEGRKMSKFTPLTSYHIGIAMAKMHKATENFAIDRYPYNAKTLLSDSLKRTKAFFTSPNEDIDFAERLTHHLTREYEKVNTANVRHGAVHLDIWFDNMHINGENEVTIFDFDFCGSGWLCHDIAYFLFQLYNTNQGENEYEPKAESFLEGYETIVKITDEEKRIIPIVGLSVFLFFLSIQCDKYDTWSNIFLNEDHLKRFIGQLKRWMVYNKMNIE